MCKVTPNFVKFKLYRDSLYDSEFYRSATETLLNIELNFKSKAISRLKVKVQSLSDSLYNNLSLLDRIYVKHILGTNIDEYVFDVKNIHDRKLLNLI